MVHFETRNPITKTRNQKWHLGFFLSQPETRSAQTRANPKPDFFEPDPSLISTYLYLSDYGYQVQCALRPLHT